MDIINKSKIGVTSDTKSADVKIDKSSPSFNVSLSDQDLVENLLDLITNKSSSNNEDVEQLVQTIQIFFASSGVNVVDKDALQALASGMINGKLPSEMLNSIVSLEHWIRSLPSYQQKITLSQMIDYNISQLNSHLAVKELTSSQITTIKELIDEISTLQHQYNQILQVSNTDENIHNASKRVDISTIEDSAESHSITPSIAITSNSSTSQNSVLPYVPITSQAGNLTPATIVQGNMDVIMQAIIIMFSYINNVQTVTMQNYENNYVTIANNMTVATNMQQSLLEVTQFMSYNVANISSLPGGSINVFYALDVMMNPSGALSDGEALGICPSGVIPNVYTQFLNNCPNFMSALETSYNQYKEFNGSGTASFIQLAAGDGITSGSPNGQAQIMTMFTGSVNGAGYSISGLGSQPIFSQAWTNNSDGGGSALYPNASLYVDASGNRINTYPVGYQLSFNPSSVASFIGSGGTGQSSNSGALGIIGTTLTNGSTNSNQVQSLMAAITQSISGIWQLIGQNFIPADKFVG